MLALSVLGVFQRLSQDTANQEAPVAKVGGRTLRGYGEPKKAALDKKKSIGPTFFILMGPFGLGLLAFGVWQMQQQGQLLQKGVAVVGYISDMRLGGKHAFIAYRFEDDSGVVHEGRYRPTFGEFSEDQLGEEVTVVYDPANPRRHLLDTYEVRRADARGRRLSDRHR
jgi:hypothetical protein